MVGSITSAYLDDYRKMFDNELFADFMLVTCDLVTLKAHKVVLSARSPVFYAMLTSDMQEAAAGVANIRDFDSRVMKEVLRFIYYAEVQNMDKIARDLVFAAEKYQLDMLKEMCLENIRKNLKVRNLTCAFLISDRVSNASKLYVDCVDMLVA